MADRKVLVTRSTLRISFPTYEMVAAVLPFPG
jgi:hypothetical protein